MIYRGSVQVDQGTLRVTADTMTIESTVAKTGRLMETSASFMGVSALLRGGGADGQAGV